MRMQNLNRWKTVLVLSGVSVLCSLSLTAFRPALSAEPETGLSDLLLRPLNEDCDCECTDDCEIQSQHAWQCGAAYDGWERGDQYQHECETASCALHQHEECGPTEEEGLEGLDMALSTLSGPDLMRLLDRNRDRLFWNRDRGAVQLWGCGEEVLLSIQLSDRQAAAFSEG